MSLLTQFYSGGGDTVFNGSVAGPYPSFAFYESTSLEATVTGGSGSGTGVSSITNGSYDIFGTVAQQDNASGGQGAGRPIGILSPNSSNPVGVISSTGRIWVFNSVTLQASSSYGFAISGPRVEEIYNWSLSLSSGDVTLNSITPVLKKISGLFAIVNSSSSFGTNGISTLTTVENVKIVYSGPTISGVSISFTGASLDAASVNEILIAADTGYKTNPGASFGGCTVNLSGGNSAGTSALTAAGLAARNSLVSKGFTVSLNP